MCSMTAIPRSVEAFRAQFGRAPTVLEFNTISRWADPATPTVPVSNGCDCYDPECYVCDPTGQMNASADDNLTVVVNEDDLRAAWEDPKVQAVLKDAAEQHARARAQGRIID